MKDSTSETNWELFDSLTDEMIDRSELPPLDDAFFARARRRLPREQIKEETMSTPILEAALVEQTEHPHIVRVPGTCGGRPIIKGSRISVRHIAVLYKRGALVEEIIQDHPHLSPAAVHDAISYYLDHQTEIEQEIAENRMEYLAAKHNFTVDERGFVHFNRESKAANG